MLIPFHLRIVRGSRTAGPVRSLQFESIATSLKGKNVKFFKEPKEESFGKHAIIEDPDGHLISIAEIKSVPTEGFDLMGLIGAE